MKILIAVFAALALSACASPPASNAPALAASTSKAPYDYAMCVLPKWQRQAPGVALVEEGRGYRLADAGQWLEVQPARVAAWCESMTSSPGSPAGPSSMRPGPVPGAARKKEELRPP
ncbi:hypothetical protein AAHB60_07740 [Pseudomonas aeruginosa]